MYKSCTLQIVPNQKITNQLAQGRLTPQPEVSNLENGGGGSVAPTADKQGNIGLD
jgi:hypothetical protein